MSPRALLAFVVLVMMLAALRPAVSQSVEIRVVDVETRKPVPDAMVYWWMSVSIEDGAKDPLDEWLIRGGADAPQLPLLGKSDASGRATLTVPSPCGHVVASTKERWGTSRIFTEREPDAAPVDLSVSRDWNLQVRVVDAGGKPALDVPVALGFRSDKFDYSFLRMVRPTAGETAIATLTHAGFWIASELAIKGVAADMQAYVGLHLCVEPPARLDITSKDRPQAPLVLQLPATGALEVNLLEPDGSLTKDPFEVGIERIAATKEDDLVPGWMSHPDLSWIDPADGRMLVRASHGRITLPRVGLGFRFRALARRNEASYVYIGHAPGPLREGESARLTVSLDRTRYVELRGRVLAGDGIPLANSELSVSLVLTPAKDQALYANTRAGEVCEDWLDGVRTDDAGGFAVDFDDERRMAAAPALLFRHRPNAPDEQSARIDISSYWHIGRNVLGDITLARSPLLAEGVTVDANDHPVAAVRVALSPEGPGLQTPHYWTSTDARGHFELRGHALGNQIGLDVTKAGCASVYSHRHDVGTTGLRIVIQRAGAIHGALIIPQGADASDFSVSCHQENGEGNQSGGVNDDATFRYQGLEPGLWRVTISSGGWDQKIAEVTGVVVRGGETSEIAPIHLDTTSHVHALRVLDAETREPLAGTYDTRPVRGDQKDDASEPEGMREMRRSMRRQRPKFQHGELRITCEHAELDIELFVSGHRHTRVHSNTTPQEVLVPRGLPIRVRLKGKIAPLPEPWLLKVELFKGTDHSHVMFDEQVKSTAFDAQGEAVVLVPEPGDYAIAWVLEHPRPGGFTSHDFHDQSQRLTVTEAPAERLVVLVPLAQLEHIDWDTLDR